MNRLTRQLLVGVLLATSVTGCHPTQPFYLHEDGDLSHYLDQATTRDYPDVEEASLAEVTESFPPRTVTDPDEYERWELTLEDVVSIALQNSKVVRNLGSLTQFTIADGLVGRTAAAGTIYDPSIISADPQFGPEAALAAFDAQFQGAFSWSNLDRPQNLEDLTAPNPNTPIFFQQNRGQLDLSLAKRTASGSTFTARHQTIYDRSANFQNLTTSRALESDWFASFELEATQPLLRGFGTQVNRAPIVIARIREDISIADFEIAIRDMLMDIENSYWELHLSYRSLDAAKKARDTALETWRIASAKSGQAVSGQEEAQSREQYYFFRAQLETAKRDVLNNETRLRWLMGLSPTDSRLVLPSDEPTLAEVSFEWHDILNEAMYRSAELRRQRWVLKQRETELITARNGILPQLDLTANYRWLGLGDDLLDPDRRGLNYVAPNSTAYDELTEGNYQESTLSLTFTPPAIGARREMAAIRFSQLNISREKARLEDMELNVTHVLNTAVQNKNYFFRFAQTHYNRWLAATRDVEFTEALYRGEGGRAGGATITLDQVLQAQQRRAEAEVEFYRAIIEYNKAIADVHYRKGSLLAHNNIQLAEGPWPDKAYWDALERARERDASYYWNYGDTRPKVISRGPLDAPLGTIPSLEEIPMGTPTPATPESLPPEGAEAAPLNAPMIPQGASIRRSDNRVQAASHETKFDWGDLGLGPQAQPAPPQSNRTLSGDAGQEGHAPAGGVELINPLRK